MPPRSPAVAGLDVELRGELVRVDQDDDHPEEETDPPSQKAMPPS